MSLWTAPDLLTDLQCQQHHCATWTLQFVCVLQSLAFPNFIQMHDWTSKCSDCLLRKVIMSDVSCSLFDDSSTCVRFMGKSGSHGAASCPAGLCLPWVLPSAILVWFSPALLFVSGYQSMLNSPTASLWWLHLHYLLNWVYFIWLLMAWCPIGTLCLST